MKYFFEKGESEGEYMLVVEPETEEEEREVEEKGKDFLTEQEIIFAEER